MIIDGGNSYYRDDIQRAGELSERGIHYVDCGTSGGVFGLERGFCLMIGGERGDSAPRSDLSEYRSGCGLGAADAGSERTHKSRRERLPALRAERRGALVREPAGLLTRPCRTDKRNQFRARRW